MLNQSVLTGNYRIGSIEGKEKGTVIYLTRRNRNQKVCFEIV